MKRERLKLIAFDLGYTLAYNRREDYYMKFLESEQVSKSREEVEKAYHLADKKFMRCYQGVLGNPAKYYMPWYIGFVNYYLGLKFDIVEQVNFIKKQGKNGLEYWQPFPWTPRVLDTLKNHGFELALLSNWDLSCRDVLQHLGVGEHFDYTIVSSELNISKPDVRIFEHLIDVSKLGPDQILYVGDNYYDDVIGAGKAGIDTVLINRFAREGIEEINVPYLVGSTLELLNLLDLRDDKRGE